MSVTRATRREDKIQSASAVPVWSHRRAHDPVSLEPLQSLACFQVRRAHGTLSQGFQARLQAQDISLVQYCILVVIQRNPGLSQTDLGQALGIDRSTMVTLIDRLQSRGLVTRKASPNDRRSYALMVKPDGEALLCQIAPIVEAYERSLAGGLNEGERAQLLSLLQKLGDESAGRPA